MKNLSVILACILVAFISCTKSKEVHPELGDGNDESITVGIRDVHVEYTRSDIAELSKVVFHYGPADANGHAQQFATAEMTKKETFFELTLDDLLSDTLYWYYYHLFPKDGDIFVTDQKAFHTQALEGPVPPTPPVAGMPSVITTEVVEITGYSAKCGGDITNDGGAEVTERGICWSTNSNPTLSDSHIAAGVGTGAFIAVMSGLQTNTTYHVRAYAINEAGTAYGLEKEFKTLPGGGSFGEHEYVDLCLPSGTLWATCNIGAESPEGFGNLFAWGEANSKDNFSWGNYQYCRGNGTSMTKYCNNSYYGYNGFTDTLTVLLPNDDPARANWGSDWRMPTKEDWQELLDNTTGAWTTQNGVNGWLFTADCGNTLFVPAAGYYGGNGQGGAGISGSYWLSSLYTNCPADAWYFRFNSSDSHIRYTTRGSGLSVRPVRVANP